jgi:hypothetical protein
MEWVKRKNKLLVYVSLWKEDWVFFGMNFGENHKKSIGHMLKSFEGTYT